MHAEGDSYGRAFRLRAWQKRFLYRLYETDPAGRRLWRQALWGLPRGNGKTEIAAAIAAYELAGGERVSPVVVVAAASWDQADLVFGALKTMCRVSPTLSRVTEVYDAEILLVGAPGRAFRVAAVAGTNEGQRPTCVIADELHEWVGSRERVWTVLTSGAAKREGSLALAITTAGWDRSSLCYRLYDRGRRIEAGEADAEGYLFEWWEAPEGTEAPDRAAWRACNPALGDFLAEESLAGQLAAIPEHEFRRYHLNQWVAAGAAWLPAGAWEGCADPGRGLPEEGAEVVLGFDGSYNDDATALVAATPDRHVLVLGCWERPEGHEDWVVPREEVDAAVRAAFARWRVRRMQADPAGWVRELEAWAETFGEERVVHRPTNNRAFMGQACAAFYADVVQGRLSHDADPRLARHIGNARVRETPEGAYITKDGRMSPRKIDLAIAALLAHDGATRAGAEPVPGIRVAGGEGAGLSEAERARLAAMFGRGLTDAALAHRRAMLEGEP